MYAALNVRFELGIDEDETIPLAIPVEFVTEQNVGAVPSEPLACLPVMLAG